MRRALLKTAVCLLGLASLAVPVRADDSAAIETTVRNYLEGWFSSDVERMTAALHPNLFKCTVKDLQGKSGEFLGVMTAEELIALTGHNQDWVQGKRFHEMEIVFQNERFAVVHAVSDGFYDVCTLVKMNGQWKILQVVWGRAPGG